MLCGLLALRRTVISPVKFRPAPVDFQVYKKRSETRLGEALKNCSARRQQAKSGSEPAMQVHRTVVSGSKAEMSADLAGSDEL